MQIGCSLLGLEASVLMIATIATAMPTATNGYVVAQEMGGDAPRSMHPVVVQTLLLASQWIRPTDTFYKPVRNNEARRSVSGSPIMRTTGCPDNLPNSVIIL